MSRIDGPKPTFRPDIEGLRAVAVVLVVLCHAGLSGTAGGYVGVDVFFVISGYLITTQLLRELRRDGTVSLRRFYARRVKRLLPAATVVVVATVLASTVWLSPYRVRDIAWDAVTTALYTLNYRLAWQGTDYLASSLPPSPLQHFWSLAVEEQFYVVWPVLLVLIALSWRRCARAWPVAARHPVTVPVAAVLLALAAASLVLSEWVTRVSAPWAYFSLPTRAWELAAGGLLAVAGTRHGPMSPPVATVVGWAGLGAIAAAAALFDDTTAFPGHAALLPVAGAVAVIAAGRADAPWGTSALLRLWPVRSLGTVSYGWYLWHWPLLAIAPVAVGRPLSVGEGLAWAVVALLLAVVTYHLVEHPVRRIESLAVTPWRGLALGGALSAVTVAVSLVLAVSPPVPDGATPGAPAAAGTQPVTAEALTAALDAGSRTRAAPADLAPSLAAVRGDLPRTYADGCHLDPPEKAQGVCTYGRLSGAVTVVLFGDSFAAQWFPALERLAKERHWRLVSLTKSSCPAVTITTYSPALKREFSECDDWRQYALRRIADVRPQLVVMGSAPIYSADGSRRPSAEFDEAWGRGTADTVRTLRGTGAGVAVLGATPLAGSDPPECVASHLADTRSCVQRRGEGLVAPRRQQLEARAAVAADAVVIDPVRWVCTSLCPVIVGNRQVYRDPMHLTATYSAWLAPVLGPLLDDALGTGSR
jgi:peptidoglycan/LPS O-acetylase OafA/YrhL